MGDDSRLCNMRAAVFRLADVLQFIGGRMQTCSHLEVFVPGGLLVS